jgi:hypothetical protein
MGQFLQDAESMLRTVLQAGFHQLGPEEVQRLLEGKQSDREFLLPDLNKALLAWAEEQGSKTLRDSLNTLLVERRKIFRAANTVWTKVTNMMASDKVSEDGEQPAIYLHCVEYLTFNELCSLFLDVLDRTIAPLRGKGGSTTQLAERWREYLAKIQRMRNRVAHLRNIPFQDMEDITRTLVSMRKDLLRLWAPEEPPAAMARTSHAP